MSRVKRVSFEILENYISDALADGASQTRSRIVRELLCTELTEKQRKYLLMRYVKNLSGSEIAKLCGVSRSSVSVTLSRARKRIARLLGTQRLREDLDDFISAQ